MGGKGSGRLSKTDKLLRTSLNTNVGKLHGEAVNLPNYMGVKKEALKRDSTDITETGMTDPMTTRGDMIYRDNENLTKRKPLGSANQFLMSDGLDLVYSNLPFLSVAGDIIYRNSSNVTARLGLGSPGHVLTASGGGLLSYQAIPTQVAGSDTQIQYNNSGVFGASSDFTFNNSTKVLDINGDIKISLDDKKLMLGTGNDCSISYDGTDMLFDSQEVGTGNYVFQNGDIGVDSKIFHNGDTNTYIEFNNDQFSFYAGGLEMIRVIESFTDEIRFNPNQADVNYRFATQNNANMLRIDGGLDYVTIGAVGSDSTLGLTGSLSLSIETITTNTTLDKTHHTVLVDATSGNITVTLPQITGNLYRVYTVKKIDSSSNTVTIDGYSSETIDGATTQTLSSQYDKYSLQNDGTEWWLI